MDPVSICIVGIYMTSSCPKILQKSTAEPKPGSPDRDDRSDPVRVFRTQSTERTTMMDSSNDSFSFFYS